VTERGSFSFPWQKQKQHLQVKKYRPGSLAKVAKLPCRSSGIDFVNDLSHLSLLQILGFVLTVVYVYENLLLRDVQLISVQCLVCWSVLAYRSDNFIVGLSNSDPASLSVNGSRATKYNVDLWDYTVCGQYPGPVPPGSTVSVQCSNVCEQGLHFKYVIVQFPLPRDHMNFCEIEVFTIGMMLLKSVLFFKPVSNV